MQIGSSTELLKQSFSINGNDKKTYNAAVSHETISVSPKIDTFENMFQSIQNEYFRVVANEKDPAIYRNYLRVS